MSDSWLFRQTHQVEGRKRLIDQSNTELTLLRYGRIVLPGKKPPIAMDTKEEEIGLICLRGEGKVEVNGQSFGMKKYDALYLPRQTAAQVTSSGAFDLAECAAPVSRKYPVQFVSFAEVLKNP